MEALTDSQIVAVEIEKIQKTLNYARIPDIRNADLHAICLAWVDFDHPIEVQVRCVGRFLNVANIGALMNPRYMKIDFKVTWN